MRYWLSNTALLKIMVMGGVLAALAGCTKDPRKAEPQARVEKEAKPEPPPASVPVIVYDPKQHAEPAPPEIVDEKPDAPKLAPRKPVVPVYSVPSLPTPAAPEPAVPEPAAPEPALTQGTKPKNIGTEPKKELGMEPKNEFKVPEEVDGKTFEQWRKEIKSDDPTKRETAMRKICLFGPEKAYEAVKDIVDQLNRHNKPRPIDLDVRVNGIMALSTIFSHKKRPDEKDDKEGAALLEKHIKEAHGVYKMFLKDPQVIMKVRTVQGLPFLGWSSRDLLPDVITLAQDPISWEVRQEAIKIMVVMARDAKGVTDTNVLKRLRTAAAGTGGALGKDKDPSYLVRKLAVQALGAVGDSTVLVDLKKVIDKDESKEVRLEAIPAYAAVGKSSVLVDLFRLLDNSNPKEIRLITLQTLASMKLETPENKAATIRKLKAHLSNEPEPILNIWTHAVIITIDPAEMKNHMPTIVRWLNNKELPVRLATLQMIGLGGEKAKPFALPAVLSALNDNDAQVVNTAMQTLVHLQEFSPIVQRLNNKDQAERLTALQMIAMGGEKAKPFALEAVRSLLDDKDLKVAIAAAGTLVQLHAFETIPLLESIAKNPKADEHLKGAAEAAVYHFKALKIQLEKAKKAPDKK